MSSSLRRLQRDVIRNKCYMRNGNKKSFKNEWEKFHYGEVEETNDEGEVIAVKSNKVEKPKKQHFDNGKSYMKYIKAMKAFAENVRNKSHNKSSAREKVC